MCRRFAGKDNGGWRDQSEKRESESEGQSMEGERREEIVRQNGKKGWRGDLEVTGSFSQIFKPNSGYSSF
jgi:hypothetical protein